MSCASELSANAVIHTASGDGGFFTVEVSYPRSGLARVSVTDAGGPTEPAAGAPVTDGASDDEIGDLPTCGLGLALVAGAASRWGYTASGSGSGRTVWAEAAWPVPVASETSAVSRQPGSPQSAAGGTGTARPDQGSRVQARSFSFRAGLARGAGSGGPYPRSQM